MHAGFVNLIVNTVLEGVSLMRLIHFLIFLNQYLVRYFLFLCIFRVEIAAVEFLQSFIERF
jgi:hypothetical protein